MKKLKTDLAITASNGALVELVHSDSTGVSAKLILSNLTGQAIYVETNTNTTYAYAASETGSTVEFIDSGPGLNYRYKIVKHGEKTVEAPFVTNGEISVIYAVVPDPAVSVSSTYTVHAYTTLTTLDMLYDYLSYYETTSAGIKYTQLGSKDGDALNLGTYNLVVNNTGSVFTFDGTTITINSSSLSVGTKFTQLKTSGSIIVNTTLADGMTFRDASSVRLINHTNIVTALDTVLEVQGTIDIGAWILTSSSLKLFANASIITGGRPGITIDANGFTLTRQDGVITPIEVTSLASSSVKVITNTNTEAAYSASSTGTYNYSTPIGSTGVWKVVIDRAGYDPIIVPFTADGASKSIFGTLTPIRRGDGTLSYTGETNSEVSIVITPATPRLVVNIGNTVATASQVLSMVENALATSDGMAFIANGGGRISYEISPAGILMNLGTNVYLNGTSVNSGLGAYVESTNAQVIVSGGGGLNYLSATDSAKLGEFQNKITLDPINGVDSGDHPAGTPLKPCKTIANCVALKAAWGLSRVFLKGPVTADVGATGLTFFGNNIYPFDLNNKSFIYCKFERVKVRGVDSNSSTDDEFVSCLISAPLSARGYFDGCAFENTTITPTEHSSFVGCISRGSGAAAVTFANPDGYDICFRDWYGGLKLANMSSGTACFGTSEGSITIDATCTGSTQVHLEGAAHLINQSSLDIDVNSKVQVTEDSLKTAGSVVSQSLAGSFI